MSNPPSIPASPGQRPVKPRTPWSRRWSEFRHGALPAIVFTLAAAATAYLWHFNTGLFHAVGEVEAIAYEIISPADGLLVQARPQGDRRVLDLVERGELLAELSPDLLLAGLAVARAEVAQLTQELLARRAEWEQSQAEFELDQRSEHRRLAVALERLRLDVLDRRAALQANRIELNRRQVELQAKKESYDSGAIRLVDVTLLQLSHDQLAEQIVLNEAALKEAEDQAVVAAQRLDGLAAGGHRDEALDVLLSPLRAAVAVVQARMEELHVQLERTLITAPADGMISAVHRRAGEHVRLGDPIMTIASSDSRWIVVYVREEQNRRPRAGEPVTLRLRSVPRRSWQAVIDRVGTRYEEVRPHLRKNPQFLEWGLPVRIALPPDSPLKPGELVDISMQPRRLASET